MFYRHFAVVEIYVDRARLGWRGSFRMSDTITYCSILPSDERKWVNTVVRDVGARSR